MDNKIPISKIMTKDVITVNVNDPLQKVKDLFRKHKIRHMPVLDGKKVVGIISLTDILRLSFGILYSENDDENEDDSIYNTLSINQIMKHHPETVDMSLSVEDLSKRFITEEFHAFPVESNGKLTGIVTTTDIIKYLISDLK